MREVIVFPGQKVITTSGDVVIVAFIICDKVWAFTSRGLLPVQICTDVFGGEHDQTLGLLAV